MGGSFDPPHISHKAMIEDVLQRDLVDEVWVCPSFYHPEKKNQVSFEHRMKMCGLMFKGMFGCFKPKIKICDYEKYNRSGWICGLAWKLQDEFPNYTFKIIIGQDCADNIKSWMNWSLLIQEFPFIVFKREDYINLKEFVEWYREKPHQIIYNRECWCSSTYVRDLIKKGFVNIARMITINSRVFSYIHKHKLYGS